MEIEAKSWKGSQGSWLVPECVCVCVCVCVRARVRTSSYVGVHVYT